MLAMHSQAKRTSPGKPEKVEKECPTKQFFLQKLQAST
jgi:hypothetical protein